MLEKIKFSAASYILWSCLVLLNAAMPFLLYLMALHPACNLCLTPEYLTNNKAHYLGIGLAVISFIIIYARLDYSLIRRGHSRLSWQLRLSAAANIATLLLQDLHIVIGRTAIKATIWLTNYDVTSHSMVTGDQASRFIELISTYITTMIDATLLSVLVATWLLVISLTHQLIKRVIIFKNSSA